MKLFPILFFLLSNIVSAGQSKNEAQIFFIDSLLSKNLVGKTMPLFTLQDKKGKSHTNTELNNKITFINLWFEACAPCIAEMNALETLYKDFKQNRSFQFWSITYENKNAIKRIVRCIK